MNFTLFIDESGDFTTRRGEWVVAGLLYPDTLENATRRLETSFFGLAQTHGVSEDRHFHATELRPHYTREEFAELQEAVLMRPFTVSAPCRLLAVVNVAKHKLSSAELTYRLMLQDLLALMDAGLSAELTRLDLVIATRTIDRVLQTTYANIDADVLKTLPSAMEAGLASRGLITSLDTQRIHVHQENAKNSWGLRVADFAANLVFHRSEAPVKAMLERFHQQERMSVFESFGGYEQRRARVAERDGDPVMAMQRWLLVRAVSDAAVQEKREALERLTRAIVNAPGTTAARNSIEVLIERLQRSTPQPDDQQHRFDAIVLLEDCLSRCGIRNARLRDALLFRVRNYLLLCANHLGDSDMGRRVQRQQEHALGPLSQSPEDFHKVTQFLLYRVEVANNDLDFPESTRLARAHLEWVEEFHTLLGCLPIAPDLVTARRTETWLKAQTTMLRCLLLGTSPSNSASLQALCGQLEELDDETNSAMDSARLMHYRIWALLKGGLTDQALTLAHRSLPSQPRGFDLFWVARAAVDWALAHPGQTNSETDRALDTLRSQKVEEQAVSDQRSLLLREQAMLEYLTRGDTKKAGRLFGTVLKVDARPPARSPYNLWKTQMVRLHGDFVKGQMAPSLQYFGVERDGGDDEGWIARRCRELAETASEEDTAAKRLVALRQVSPL